MVLGLERKERKEKEYEGFFGGRSGAFSIQVREETCFFRNDFLIHANVCARWLHGHL